MMPSIRFFSEIGEGDRESVGGKALSLGRLAAAGFPVPPGFAITAQALEQGMKEDGTIRPELERDILDARARLGPGLVAVRSSAVFEDAAAASFAGQLETLLGVCGDQELIAAVGHCWQAGHSERVAAYRKQWDRLATCPEPGHIRSEGGRWPTGSAEDKDGDRLTTCPTAGEHGDRLPTCPTSGIAIVVQSLVEADAAGVLFTVDVASGRRDRMLIDSAWGLGESVVSGAVNPDHFVLDKATGAVVEQHLADKAVMRSSAGPLAVAEERRRAPSLTVEQAREIASHGKRLEEMFGCPQDIEWAIASGRLYLLQSRPITTLQKLDRAPSSEIPADLREEIARLRQEEIAELRDRTHPRGTVWSSYGISEVLPEPYPMTWAITAQFMSGRGGLGLAYSDLGFAPAREACGKGMLDLVCGRPYVNLSREIQMHLAEFCYEYDFAELKANPSRASYPAPRVNVGSVGVLLRLPLLPFRMTVAEIRMARLRKHLARRLSEEVFPRFAEWAAAERAEPPEGLSPGEIVERFEEYRRRVMTDFVRGALKATILANLAYADLAGLLEQHLSVEAGHYLAALASGERADVTVEMDEALWRVGTGEKSLEEFLAVYGHRGVGEFELARPRWREDPRQVERLAHLAVRRGERSPAELYETHKQHQQETMDNLQRRLARLSGAVRDRIERQIALLRRYMPFRESVKHYWMMGYELLRRCLLALDRRYEMNGLIFFLRPNELPDLVKGRIIPGRIKERQLRRERVLRIPVPPVIFSDDLEAIGRLHEPAAGEVLEGVGVSEGVATGIARVLLEPTDLGEQESGYVLVCPSTDPGWTPLFARARALVMERGGVLSHGAIVAREYGLPAVVNVLDATLRIAPGRQVRVDGNQGKVWLL